MMTTAACPTANKPIDMPISPAVPARLRLLSYNIQAGIPTANYLKYITGSWRHVIADDSKHKNLAQIAAFLKDFDVVALQEADAGSLRSGYINQIEYLARKAGFAHWHYQTNRNLRQFGQHSNGILCRFNPHTVDNHKLPGMIPGRGAIVAKFGCMIDPLVVVVLHLALGQRARRQQLQYITDLIGHYNHVIIMGDMNCSAEKLMSRTPLARTNLLPASYNVRTFPSWEPKRDLDHILVSPTVEIKTVKAIAQTYSDHLPLAIEVTMPTPLAKLAA